MYAFAFVRSQLEERKASIGARGRSSVVPALTTSQSNRSLSVSSVANSVDESRTTRVASSIPVARPAIKRKATTEVEAPCDRRKEVGAFLGLIFVDRYT